MNDDRCKSMIQAAHSRYRLTDNRTMGQEMITGSIVIFYSQRALLKKKTKKKKNQKKNHSSEKLINYQKPQTKDHLKKTIKSLTQ